MSAFFRNDANIHVHVTLVAITGTTILLLYRQVKSLQLTWRSRARRFHLQMSDLKISSRDLTTWQIPEK